jgi:hypothetical protein
MDVKKKKEAGLGNSASDDFEAGDNAERSDLLKPKILSCFWFRRIDSKRSNSKPRRSAKAGCFRVHYWRCKKKKAKKKKRESNHLLQGN